jgi:hypothetical protein
VRSRVSRSVGAVVVTECAPIPCPPRGAWDAPAAGSCCAVQPLSPRSPGGGDAWCFVPCGPTLHQGKSLLRALPLLQPVTISAVPYSVHPVASNACEPMLAVFGAEGTYSPLRHTQDRVALEQELFDAALTEPEPVVVAHTLVSWPISASMQASPVVQSDCRLGWQLQY